MRLLYWIGLIVLVSFLLVRYTSIVYQKGLQDGELNYKQSHRIYMAFKSAYHFGYMDCKDGRRESWEGE
jgi:hypothetical protein